MLVWFVVIGIPVTSIVWVAVKQIRKYPNKKTKFLIVDALFGLLRWLKKGPYADGRPTLEQGIKSATEKNGNKPLDFGNDNYLRTFDAVTTLPAHKALRLTNVGFLMYQDKFKNSIFRKTGCIQYYKENPELLNIPLRSPVFVVGLPRSGTTFMHRLLSLDPAVRAPLLWELMRPVPINVTGPEATQRQDLFDTDRKERLALVHESFKKADAMGFEIFNHIHETDPELPEECYNSLGDDIPYSLSMFYTFFTNYKTVLKNIPFEQSLHAYESYRKVLQLLTFQIIDQRKQPPRWVLKCPFHLYFIPALATVFPDAKLIW